MLADYKKKNVKKVKAVKPKKSAVSENYKITSFKDIDEEINVKSAKEARAERRFEKKKTKYLNKSKPEKRVVYSNKSAAELNKSSGIHIVKGTKGTKRIKRLSTLISAALIIITIIFVNSISPTGIIDLIRNSVLTMGVGTGFPKSVSGNNVVDVFSLNGGIGVVSDTYIEIFNSDGKEIISLQHGYYSPSVSVSENRILLYANNSNTVSVFDYSGLLYTREFKNTVYAAEIGRNGSFCVVSSNDDSASVIEVYDKNNKRIFKWDCSDRINSFAISDNGKYVAAATLNAKNGEYVSKINIFKGNNNKPFNQLESNKLILSVNSSGRSKFIVCDANNSYLINAKNTNKEDIIKSIPLQYITKSYLGFCCVTGADSNIDASRVTVKKNNKNIYDFDIVSYPNKVAYSKNYLAAAKGSSIYVYNDIGKNIWTIDCGVSADKFTIIENKVFVVNNNSLYEHKIVDKE